MASSPERGLSAAEQVHRHETIRYIVLPFIGVGVVLIAGVLLVLLLPGRLQVALIADWLLTILVLCPLVICLFPICILMVAAVVGMNKAHDALANPLRRLENLSETVTYQVSKTTDAINRQTVNASARWAFVDHLLSFFDPPAPPNQGEKEE